MLVSTFRSCVRSNWEWTCLDCFRNKSKGEISALKRLFMSIFKHIVYYILKIIILKIIIFILEFHCFLWLLKVKYVLV